MHTFEINSKRINLTASSRMSSLEVEEFQLSENQENRIALANQCRLYVRITHPLFKTQSIGLEAGIQYQGA